MLKSASIGRSNYDQIAKYWHFWLKTYPHWIMLRKKSWILYRTAAITADLILPTLLSVPLTPSNAVIFCLIIMQFWKMRVKTMVIFSNKIFLVFQHLSVRRMLDSGKNIFSKWVPFFGSNMRLKSFLVPRSKISVCIATSFGPKDVFF